MGLIVLGVGVLIVLGIVYLVVFRLSQRLAVLPAPAVLEVDTAVEWIIERLPFEVTASLSEDDVQQIVLWNLDWFDEQGLASEFGEELAGSEPDEDVVAETESSLDFVVEQALKSGRDIDPVHAAVVNERFLEHLVQIGAVGEQADPSA